jgi:phosphoribosylglycinamide formyltransferase 1
MNTPSSPQASPKKRVAVLISGRGSNMEALIAAAEEPDYPAEIALIVSNRADAQGLVTAAKKGIATDCVDHKNYPTREAFEEAIDAVLKAHSIDYVCLAGFMRILTPLLIERWLGKLINIHPSLLPEFKGLHTHKRAIEAGVKEHGCTAHFVVPELDAGPTIAQARVEVLLADTEASLAQKVLQEEHKLYPYALRLLVEGKTKII